MIIENVDISLASATDAPEIASMSKALIEAGLSWRYRPERVLERIKTRGTNVAVAKLDDDLIGFGIMRYGESKANLDLLAVKPEYARQGVGSAIVRWLEVVATTAGIQWVYVQAREENRSAIDFYKRLGYVRRDLRLRTYDGIGNSVRMVKNLAAES